MTDQTKQATLGIMSDVTAALTILAQLPYTLGELSIVVPPDWKPWVTGCGLGATLVLQIIKRWNELKATPPKP